MTQDTTSVNRWANNGAFDDKPNPFKKVYRAELAHPDNDEAIDLVNVIDEHDRIMAAPDEFIVGWLYDEDAFVIKDADYVDDNGVGHAPFAYNVQFHLKD